MNKTILYSKSLLVARNCDGEVLDHGAQELEQNIPTGKASEQNISLEEAPEQASKQNIAPEQASKQNIAPEEATKQAPKPNILLEKETSTGNIIL